MFAVLGAVHIDIRGEGDPCGVVEHRHIDNIFLADVDAPCEQAAVDRPDDVHIAEFRRGQHIEGAVMVLVRELEVILDVLALLCKAGLQRCNGALEDVALLVLFADEIHFQIGFDRRKIGRLLLLGRKRPEAVRDALRKGQIRHIFQLCAGRNRLFRVEIAVCVVEGHRHAVAEVDIHADDLLLDHAGVSGIDLRRLSVLLIVHIGVGINLCQRGKRFRLDDVLLQQRDISGLHLAV